MGVNYDFTNYEYPRKGGRYGWKPSSSSNVLIRVVRAYPPNEIRQTAPSRAIRGNSISVSSTLPPLKGRREREDQGRQILYVDVVYYLYVLHV